MLLGSFSVSILDLSESLLGLQWRLPLLLLLEAAGQPDLSLGEAHCRPEPFGKLAHLILPQSYALHRQGAQSRGKLNSSQEADEFG